MKVNTNVVETRTVTKSVKLSSGGFIELSLDNETGYLKVHVGKNKSDFFSATQPWRWIQHGNDEKNISLLKEIRDGADKILKSLEGSN